MNCEDFDKLKSSRGFFCANKPINLECKMFKEKKTKKGSIISQ